MLDLGTAKVFQQQRSNRNLSKNVSEQLVLLFKQNDGVCKNAHEKVHLNFTKNLGRQLLGNLYTVSSCQPGKEKHKHKQFCGIVPGLGGWQNFVCVFFGSFLLGRKTHKQNPPQSRDNPVNILFMCLSRVRQWGFSNVCFCNLASGGGGWKGGLEREVGKGLGRAWLSTLRKPCLKKGGLEREVGKGLGRAIYVP